ncbi:MAG: YjbQ family protein [Planctomycetes bacterium]|nr:YjbQ family protein [Planctomycetota bacterium]
MPVHTDRIHLSTHGETEIQDITPLVTAALERARMKAGTCTVFVTGSTGGVTTVEYEPGLVADLQAAFERLAPRALPYEHEKRWHDGNGHSHVRASLLGPSLTVPFVDGRLTLGTWQQIVFIDFDNRPRRRELVVQFVGE